MRHKVVSASVSAAVTAAMLVAGSASAQRAAVAVAEPVEAIVTISLSVGDRITLMYTQALAADMIPER